MNKNMIIKSVKEISEPLAEELGYELVDVEFPKEGSSYFLRIYLDKVGGINLDDCQKMSHLIGDKLDEIDLIKMAYFLEISSPGLDRPLKTDKDLKRNIGKEIEIKLYEQINGKKSIEGMLEGFNDSTVHLKMGNDEIVNIPKTAIAVIKLVVKF